MVETIVPGGGEVLSGSEEEESNEEPPKLIWDKDSDSESEDDKPRIYRLGSQKGGLKPVTAPSFASRNTPKRIIRTRAEESTGVTEDTNSLRVPKAQESDGGAEEVNAVKSRSFQPI